jgi:hypothetical protein
MARLEKSSHPLSPLPDGALFKFPLPPPLLLPLPDLNRPLNADFMSARVG